MSHSAVETLAPAPELLDYIADHLRDQDRVEIAALGKTDFRAALHQSVAESNWAKVAVLNAEPIAVFGCGEYGSLLAPIGVPWLLGTDAVQTRRRDLMRLSRRYISTMLQDYPRLMNAVHADNSVSIAWLQRLGFRMRSPIAVPPHGARFHVFEMYRHV